MSILVKVGDYFGNTQRTTESIKKEGWYVERIRGSHHMLKHTSKVGRFTVPVHKEDLKPKTLHTILKQAGIK